VGRSGLIEFSKDGGSSWSRQTSGILADLLTGAAPSDQVCWIVGSAGTILLTTDAAPIGRSFRRPSLKILAEFALPMRFTPLFGTLARRKALKPTTAA